MDKWKPSFPKFLEKLDEIFENKYFSTNFKTSESIRRLKENEALLFNEDFNTFSLRDDLFIPNSIIKNCALDTNKWKFTEEKPVSLTKGELLSTLNKLSKNPKFKIKEKMRKKMKDFGYK